VCQQLRGKGVDGMRVSTLFNTGDASGVGMVVVVVSPARLLVAFILACSLAIKYGPIVKND
jgi:hypothetical protein